MAILTKRVKRIDFFRHLSIKKTISDKRGSTLAEMLITVALMGIVLSAVTTGSYALMQTYQKIVKKAEAMLPYAHSTMTPTRP